MRLTQLRIVLVLLGLLLAIAGGIAYSEPATDPNVPGGGFYKLNEVQRWTPVGHTILSVCLVMAAELLVLLPSVSQKLPGVELGLRVIGSFFFFQGILALAEDAHRRNALATSSLTPAVKGRDTAAPVLILIGNLVAFIACAVLPERASATADAAGKAARAGPSGWVSLSAVLLIVTGAIVLFADNTYEFIGLTNLRGLSNTRAVAVSYGIAIIAFGVSWFWGYQLAGSEVKSEAGVGLLVAAGSSFYLIEAIIALMINSVAMVHYNNGIGVGKLKDTWRAGGIIAWIGAVLAVLFGSLLAKGEINQDRPTGAKILRPVLSIAGVVITVVGTGIAGTTAIGDSFYSFNKGFMDPTVWYGILLIAACALLFLGLHVLTGIKQKLVVLGAACTAFLIFAEVTRWADLQRRVQDTFKDNKNNASGLALEMLGVIIAFAANLRFEKLLDNFRSSSTFKRILNLLTLVAFVAHIAGLIIWWQWLDDILGDKPISPTAVGDSVDIIYSVHSLLAACAVFVAIFVETNIWSALFAMWAVIRVFIGSLALLIAKDNDFFKPPQDADDRVTGFALVWIASLAYMVRLLFQFTEEEADSSATSSEPANTSA